MLLSKHHRPLVSVLQHSNCPPNVQSSSLIITPLLAPPAQSLQPTTADDMYLYKNEGFTLFNEPFVMQLSLIRAEQSAGSFASARHYDITYI